MYAEDSFGGFLPQAGRTSIVRWPADVRVDHALEPEQVVSTSYDPMLGKVIVHGATREDARRALVAALDDTAILGLTTNAGFLRALAASDEFRDATIDTAWLDTAVVERPGRRAAADLRGLGERDAHRGHRQRATRSSPTAGARAPTRPRPSSSSTARSSSTGTAAPSTARPSARSPPPTTR